jgi:putative tryptophan/tyrosine transport system substrate-binding protein
MIPLGAVRMAIGIGRRQFISALAGAASSWPLTVRAQETGKLSTIGYLSATTPSLGNDRAAAFVRRLRELGWIEGSNVAIDYQYAEGRSERLPELATKLVQLKVDVIVTSATAPIVAAKQATSVIPIVFALAPDPLGTGLVASLAHPGGNLTGLSIQTTDLAGKRLELMRELLPGLERLAILSDANSPSNVLEVEDAQTAARTLGLEVAAFQFRHAEDFAPSLEKLKGHTDALYVCASPLVFNNVIRINTLALEARLPTMHGNREYLSQGGLVSYGPNILDQYRRAAEFVDKILHGAKPADLPVEQPTKFELIINLKTAKTLGLSVPQTLLATADEVIE